MIIRRLNLLLALVFIFTIPSMAQWQWQNPLPFGDPIEQVFFVDSNNGWMAPQTTTLLRTTDAGENWDIIHTGIIFEDIQFINTLEGWGIGREYFEKNEYSIYHTVDGGLSWEMQVADTTTIRYDIHFCDSKHGWAVGETVLHTKDSGENWIRTTNYDFLLEDTIYGVMFTDSLNGWLLGGYSWALHTYDGGNTWEKDSTMAGISRLVSTDSLHYWGLLGPNVIVLSYDGARYWQYISYTDTTAEIWPNDIFILDNDHLYITTNLGIYYSNDGGFNWEYISDQNMNSLWMLNTMDGWGAGIYVNYSGFFYTNDGGITWTDMCEVNNEYGYENYSSLDFINDHTGWIIGNLPSSPNNFIIKTTDGGLSWITQESNTNNGLRDIYMYSDQIGWIVGNGGTILYSSDGGNNWGNQNSNVEYTLYKVEFIDAKNGWIVGGDFDFENSTVKGIILNTTDGGLHWNEKTPYSVPRLKSVSFVDSLHGWVIGGGGSAWDYGIIMRTIDGGQTWETLRIGYGMELNRVCFTDTLNGWVTGWDPDLDTKILHTDDGGITWSGQLKSAGTIQDLVFVDSLRGWICSYFGRIYHTKDGGKEWKQQFTFTSQDLFSIDFVNDSTGWAVGRYGTILSTINGGVSSINPNKKKFYNKTIFDLYPNYPNPFNPVTHINLHVYKMQSYCKIIIYDVLGRQVKIIYDGMLSNGNHIFTWNGKNHFSKEVSSGLYIYSVNVNGCSKAGKMLLIR
jgi:photosystem II stability/assembly factor-like uncharacterized protein